MKKDKAQQFIDKKMAEIAKKLPDLAHEDPASFACGYNLGYKAALLDIERELTKEDWII